MLSLPYIRENRDLVIKGLGIRNIKDAESIVDTVIDADQKRRSTQADLDAVLAESNKISKEIGKLFQSGEVQKAILAKEKTGQLKDKSKTLSEQLGQLETELKEMLYQIPNVPNDLVPNGNSEEDNEAIHVDSYTTLNNYYKEVVLAHLCSKCYHLVYSLAAK